MRAAIEASRQVATQQDPPSVRADPFSPERTMRHTIPWLLSAVPAAALAVAPSHAAAQPAAGTMKQDAATSGSTAVATEGFDAAKKAEAPKDTTEAKLQAGLLLAGGNSSSVALTSAGSFRTRRGMNDFSAAAAANYAEARLANGTRETSVENFQGKLRYDRFLTEAVALFLSISARRDRFQALDLRLNVDPGIAYYVIDQPKQQLWAEVGYDFQYDVRRDENILAEFVKSAGAVVIDKTETRHSGRAFVGYKHQLNDNVGFSTGLEFLLGLPDTEYWRLNWDVGLNASLSERFSLATTFSLKHDNHPLPGVKKTDTLTAVNLAYSLF
jgi:putative salt-induced outer membrane protein